MAYDDLDSGNMHWIFLVAFKLNCYMIQYFFIKLSLIPASNSLLNGSPLSLDLIFSNWVMLLQLIDECLIYRCSQL
jgi:hypothetical protein